MTERIIPECMRAQSQKMEAAVQKAANGGSKAVTARVENVREGQCPICHCAMQVSSANELPVLYCAEHSLVMPIRDPEML